MNALNLFAGTGTAARLETLRPTSLIYSTGRQGFAALEATIPAKMFDAFYLYDRPALIHVVISDNGSTCWEGRLEGLVIRDGEVRLTAYGYYRTYRDTTYTATHTSVTANTVVNALIASVSGTNTFMSSSTALVENPGVTGSYVFKNKTPAQILEKLVALGDTNSPVRMWEAGVYEDRVLFFRPRGSAGRSWAIDASDIEISRDLDGLYNKVSVLYQNTDNSEAETASSTDTDSVARYGLTREIKISIQTQQSAVATAARDAALADFKNPKIQARVKFKRLLDTSGGQFPLWAMRAGDTVTIRNLPPQLSISVDQIRTFIVASTKYDAVNDTLEIEPETPTPTLDFLVAKGGGTGFSGGVLEFENDAPDAVGPAVGGSGTANRVAYWSGTSTLTSSSTLTFDGTYLNTTTAKLSIGTTGGTTSPALSVSGSWSLGAGAYGVLFNPSATSSTTGEIYGVFSVPEIISTGASITAVRANYLYGTLGALTAASMTVYTAVSAGSTINPGAGKTVSRYNTALFLNPTVTTGTLTGATGVTIAEITSGTNNTNLLLGQQTIPAGSFSLYSASTRESRFAGALISTHATGGIGYGTGAGGTVTQITSKATGVTLNKITGQITMNNAALAGDTTVSFVLTNSAIAANDILILNHISGGTAGSYALNARSAAGSATIDVRNHTTGSLSEAIVIAFAVIKAVTA